MQQSRVLRVLQYLLSSHWSKLCTTPHCGAAWPSHLLQRYRNLQYLSSTNQMKPSNWCNLKQPVLVINYCSALCCWVKKSAETSQVLLESDMETLLCFVCITVASFAVLVQPAVAQETNNSLPLTYPAQFLQGDGSQTCPSEEQRERVRKVLFTKAVYKCTNWFRKHTSCKSPI